MNARLRRGAILGVVATAVLVLLGWIAATQGPLAPVKVTIARVERGTLQAGTFGIGTVEARRTYALGPTTASRVLRVLVDQGSTVRAHELVVELDPVDLADRVAGAELAAQRAGSTVTAAEAQLAEAGSRARVAGASARRYAELRARGFVSHDAADAKAHEADAAEAALQAARAQLAAAHRDQERAHAEVAGVRKLRAQSRIVSPVGGVVTARLAEPGSTVVAGQAVLHVIDPTSLWVRARIDQGRSGALRVGQRAEVVLRSDPARTYVGTVERIDWVSDAVAEERIVNVVLRDRPEALSLGELAEVTVQFAERAGVRHVPAAAVKRVDLDQGVWRVRDGRAAFHPVKVGITTLEGRTEVVAGIDEGEAVIVHSEQVLRPGAKVRIVPALAPGP